MLTVAITLSLAGLGWAFARSSPGVEVQADGSVQEVLNRLQKMVADNGMMVMGELHQARNSLRECLEEHGVERSRA
ncbi:MAG: hypothetical protein R6W82_01575 [bacterium]